MEIRWEEKWRKIFLKNNTGKRKTDLISSGDFLKAPVVKDGAFRKTVKKNYDTEIFHLIPHHLLCRLYDVRRFGFFY